MLSCVAKPLFGLIVLLVLPWLGLGGSAWAGFVLTLDRGEAGASGAAACCAEDEDRQRDAGNSWRASRVLPSLPAREGLQTSSTSGGTTSSGPTSGPGGPGLAGILLASTTVPRAVEAGLLFLRDDRFKPSPFASRLFRPPR